MAVERGLGTQNSPFLTSAAVPVQAQKKLRGKFRGRNSEIFLEFLQMVRSLHSRLWVHSKEVPSFLAKLVVWKSKCYNKTKSSSWVHLGMYYKQMYRTRAIITRGLYIFYPLFGSQKRFFKEVFSENSVLMYG